MWKLHSSILSISISLLIFIHNIMMLFNLMSYLPINLVTRELDIELNMVHRLNSHLFKKIILLLCGSLLCTFYWIFILIVRLNCNDLNYSQQIINNYLLYLWNLFILPYKLFSLILSIYIMLILIDDISLLKEDISNYMYKIFDALGSTEFSGRTEMTFTYNLCTEVFILVDYYKSSIHKNVNQTSVVLLDK